MLGKDLMSKALNQQHLYCYAAAALKGFAERVAYQPIQPTPTYIVCASHPYYSYNILIYI
jgi:hypothetical protein